MLFVSESRLKSLAEVIVSTDVIYFRFYLFPRKFQINLSLGETPYSVAGNEMKKTMGTCVWVKDANARFFLAIYVIRRFCRGQLPIKPVFALTHSLYSIARLFPSGWNLFIRTLDPAKRPSLVIPLPRAKTYVCDRGL